MCAVRWRALVGARKAAGHTQEGLAAELHVDRSTVIRWEAGDHAPLPYLWPRLARLLGQSRGQLRELIGDGSDTRPWADGAEPAAGATCVHSAADELPPHVIPSRPNLAALLAAPPEETIAYLREQWHLLVRADNLFGPAHVLRLVHEQIELIEALLRDARDGVRTPLLSLGAQYAESVSWLHEDADDQLAPLWASRALEWAHAGPWVRLRPDDAMDSSGRWLTAAPCQGALGGVAARWTGCGGVGTWPQLLNVTLCGEPLCSPRLDLARPALTRRSVA